MDSEDRSMLFLLCCLFGGLGFLTVKLLKLTWEVAKWTGDKLWIGVKWTGVNLRKGYKVLKKKWNKRQERKLLAKEKPDLNQETDKVPLLKDEQVPELQPIWLVAQQQNSVGVSDKQVDDKKSMKDAITGAVKTSIDTKNSLTNGFQINNGRSEIAHQI
ncbi:MULTISPECIES: hypothetical protein [Enterococcus]|uniref:hypothetical protein n=1 Tax=Enterococcus TaxID=1350 RepID=UPI002ECBD046|nr:hypothetical protein [Enterococcus hirae]EMF0565027.1 hypothetical protein [Enterococcus hirae]